MTDYDYDLFVIGAGSGGVRAARMAAGYGARVAVAEKSRLGGTCVNVGCVPKKLLVCASEFADHYRDAAGFGWAAERPSFDWARLIANKDREIERLNGIYRGLLEDAGVDLFEGRARLDGPHRVEVAFPGKYWEYHSAKNILVATGSWPHRPQIEGIVYSIYSDHVFSLKRLPERFAVVGGGYIGVEFAGILAGLGCQVTLIYRGELFLRGFDEEIRRNLADEMRSRGIELRFGADVEAIEWIGPGPSSNGTGVDRLRLKLSDGEELTCGEALFATGRKPAVLGLGLEDCGVELGENGEVLVDEYSRTNVPHIWAIGDVTDRLNLTPVAIHEAMCLTRTLFGGEPTAPDHETVATAVFSQPSLAAVGLTEEQARERHGEVDVYRSRFRPLKLTLTENQERTLVKLVVERSSGKVLGAHMLGADAPEIIQGLAVAVKMGATKADFDAAMAIHPTSAEEFVTLR